MEACVGLPTGPAVVAMVIRLPKLMTHTKFRWCSSAASRAGLVPVRNFRVARHTDGSSNRDERQELRRVVVLVFRKMARRAPSSPSATLLSDAQHVVSPTSHLRKTVIRRTPATGPLEGTLEISTGFSLGIESTCAGLSWVLHWRGLELGWELCWTGGRNGRCEQPTRCASQQRTSGFHLEKFAQNDFILKAPVDSARSGVIQVIYCRSISVDHNAVQKRRSTGLGTLPTTAHRVHIVQPWLPEQVLNE